MSLRVTGGTNEKEIKGNGRLKVKMLNVGAHSCEPQWQRTS